MLRMQNFLTHILSGHSLSILTTVKSRNLLTQVQEHFVNRPIWRFNA